MGAVSWNLYLFLAAIIKLTTSKFQFSKSHHPLRIPWHGCDTSKWKGSEVPLVAGSGSSSALDSVFHQHRHCHRTNTYTGGDGEERGDGGGMGGQKERLCIRGTIGEKKGNRRIGDETWEESTYCSGLFVRPKN